MGNIDLDLYILLLRRKLVLAGFIVLTALCISVAIAFLLPPVYVATAKILVQAAQIPSTLARSTVSTSAIQQFQILRQQITARESLIALARRNRIYGAASPMPGDDEIVRDLLQRITFDQVAIDTPDPGQGAAIYAVSFSAASSELAARIANELSSMILVNSQSQRTDRAGRTLSFFDQRVSDLSTQLKRIEDQILAFKNAHRNSLPESLEFRRSHQSSLQERLMSLEREEADLRLRKYALIAAAVGTGNLPGSVTLSPEQQMLSDLNRALGQQLTLFREDSPNVVALRARIARLQRDMIKTPSSAAEDRDQDTVPRFGLDLQLKEIDERLQAIAGEKTRTAASIAVLARSIEATPASETAFDALMRRRENIQTQYNSAIAGRAEALTGAQIELRSDGARFSLLEGAAPPQRPFSPRKKRIVAVGGLAGLGSAIALIVLIEMFNKTIRRPKDVMALLQAQPLGVVPLIRTRREVLRTRMKHRFAAAAGILALPVSAAVLHYYYMPLPLLFTKLSAGLYQTMSS